MRPRLRIDLLDELVDRAGVPLVLHGGSGNTDAEIARAVAHGMSKINISSDIKAAYYRRMREVLADQSLREPGEIQSLALPAMKRTALHKIRLFGAEGRAGLY